MVRVSYEIHATDKREMMLKHDLQGVNSRHDDRFRNQFFSDIFHATDHSQVIQYGNHSPNSVVFLFG